MMPLRRCAAKASVAAGLLVLVPAVSFAGWFGPSSYEECVLENMKGVGSDKAAFAIAGACRARFPLPPEPLPTAIECESHFMLLRALEKAAKANPAAQGAFYSSSRQDMSRRCAEAGHRE